MAAIYLGWSFWTMRWDITWIVWPVAGVLFAAISGIAKAIVKVDEPQSVLAQDVEDTFFPEFEIADFEVVIGETFGEEVKNTRTYYTRKK